ncbi:hypothetical protein CCACVL1_07086 [Corchorus capsularis]|uniref:Uncharacterized protein n=1 Tax=Corchorus capsularis TaxID=210143 RepID=A0A1R3J9L8_COCAP|nr:hypothetical protein CCACVL1_07086 [Corchorus capsularis]
MAADSRAELKLQWSEFGAEVEQRLKGNGKVETAQGNGENERGMRKN